MRKCKTCYHNGCCEHSCGGRHYAPRFAECSRCGETRDVDMLTSDGMCEECAAKIADDNGEEGINGNC